MSSSTATKLKERPILFSDPMVRAILEGRKTVTRRVVMPKAPFTPTDDGLDIQFYSGKLKSPYGVAGSVLWVREAWAPVVDEDGVGYGAVWYRAGIPQYFGGLLTGKWLNFPYKTLMGGESDPAQKWKPSIFMPKWACRLKLRITDVRVERLQEISDEQCIAEGIEFIGGQFDDSPVFKDYSRGARNDAIQGDGFGSPRNSFESLWDSINKKRGYGWDANPWVWAVEFERISEEAPNAA